MQTIMSKDPLRRKLFSTPPKNDAASPTRSKHLIRPKAEVTPIKLDATPSFKQLVDNSPVPLAVAAATAAMRAAKSAQNGQPIITEMTRAAEQVVKNSEYNSIRPPLPSLPFSSPRFAAVRALQSSSASLPPIPGPAARPTGKLPPQQTILTSQNVPSHSTAPVVNNASHVMSSQHRIGQRKPGLSVMQSPPRASGKRLTQNSLNQSDSVPLSSDALELRPPAPLGKHTFPSVKPNPMRRLFHPVSPFPVIDAVESPVMSPGSIEDPNNEIQSSAKVAESIEKRTKKRPRKWLKEEHLIFETNTPEAKENTTSRMQTRSVQKARADPSLMVHRDSKSHQPKKKRRMSEVLRLQKALETAAWTNSLAVERQTEVIEISDDFPTHLRVDVPIKQETRSSRQSDRVRYEASQQTTKAEKKSTSKKSVRDTPSSLKHRSSRKTDQTSGANAHQKPKATGTKGKRNSTKIPHSGRAGTNKEVAPDAPRNPSIQKKRTKRGKEKKKKRLERLSMTFFHEEVGDSDKKIVQTTSNIPANDSTTSAAERPVPLKKRITSGQRELSSASSRDAMEMETQPSSPDERHVKSSRKTSHPKRLSPPALKDPRAPPTSKGKSGRKNKRDGTKGKG